MKNMTDVRKFPAWKNLLVAIIAIFTLAYSFYTGMLLWGLIAATLIIFLWVFIFIAFCMRDYLELNKKKLELFDRYYSRKLEQLADEKPVEKK